MKSLSSNGFTLVELLVAMAIGSLLLGSLGWTIATLGRELQASDRLTQIDRLEAAAPALIGMIETAMIPDEKDVAFTLDPHKLTAIVSPPASIGSVGPVKLTLTAKRSGKDTGLFAEMKPLFRDQSLPKAAQEEVLLVDGFRDVTFRRVDQSSDGESKLPALVQIEFTDRAGVNTMLAAAPRLNSSATCRFDPISMACRP